MKVLNDTLLAALPLVLLACCQESCAFTTPTIIVGVRGVSSIKSLQYRPTSLPAKKRRRRKTSTGDVPASDDELPDFDLDDQDGEQSAKRTTSVSGVPSEPSSEISRAMMGSANQPVRSVDQLIADRALEKTFEFDEPEDESIPDLAMLAKEAEVGRKKKSKRDARVAAALERKTDEDEGSNPLAQFEFLTDDSGEVTALKILEAGTWLGIFALVGWEVYINSPLFDRSAGMAPFLFEIML